MGDAALSTQIGEAEGPREGALAVVSILTNSGVKGRGLVPSRGSEEGFFLVFLMVTFLKCMESNGRVDGDIGYLGEKINRDFIRVGL